MLTSFYASCILWKVKTMTVFTMLAEYIKAWKPANDWKVCESLFEPKKMVKYGFYCEETILLFCEACVFQIRLTESCQQESNFLRYCLYLYVESWSTQGSGVVFDNKKKNIFL